MPCLMQVFDKDGKEVLKGGATVHYRVNWLLLDSWTFDLQKAELAFTVSGDSPAIPALRAAYSNNTRGELPKAVIECFSDNVVDGAHLILRRSFGDLAISSMKSSDAPGGGSSWEFVLRFERFFPEFRSPHAEDHE